MTLCHAEVRCFTAQMLLGLMAMHAGHVIHRDLKPANIFVRLNRGQVRALQYSLSHVADLFLLSLCRFVYLFEF